MSQDDSIPFTTPVIYYSTLLWHHFFHTLLIKVFQLCLWQFKTNYWSMGDNEQYSKEVLICHLSLSLFFLVTLLLHLITLYSLFILGAIWGWVFKATPGRFTPGKTLYPLCRRLCGPQGRSGRVRKISPPPGFKPATVQPVVNRYTDWAIPAPPSSCDSYPKLT